MLKIRIRRMKNSTKSDVKMNMMVTLFHMNDLITVCTVLYRQPHTWRRMEGSESGSIQKARCRGGKTEHKREGHSGLGRDTYTELKNRRGAEYGCMHVVHVSHQWRASRSLGLCVNHALTEVFNRRRTRDEHDMQRHSYHTRDRRWHIYAQKAQLEEEGRATQGRDGNGEWEMEPCDENLAR